MRWLAVALVLLSSSTQAQETKFSDKQINAWNNVQEELSACAAYFNFGKQCAPEGAKPEELQQADRIIDHFNGLAFVVGERIGMTTDAMLARLKMALEDQAKLTEGKCVNFASLLTRYADRCKLLGEHPEAVFFEYMKK